MPAGRCIRLEGVHGNRAVLVESPPASGTLMGNGRKISAVRKPSTDPDPGRLPHSLRQTRDRSGIGMGSGRVCDPPSRTLLAARSRRRGILGDIGWSPNRARAERIAYDEGVRRSPMYRERGRVLRGRDFHAEARRPVALSPAWRSLWRTGGDMVDPFLTAARTT